MYCSILANEIKYLKQSLDKFPILFLFLLVLPSILSKIKWEKFMFTYFDFMSIIENKINYWPIIKFTGDYYLL